MRESPLRYVWLLVGVSVMPILRQFIVFKLLGTDDLPSFLFLSSLVITLTPLASLGWGDLFAGRLAISARAIRTDSQAFVVSILAITGIALGLCCVLSVKTPLLLAAMPAIDLACVAFLQNCLKLLRSLDRLRAFFAWLMVKHLIEISLLLTLSLWFRPGAALALAAEAIAAGTILCILVLRLRLWRLARVRGLSWAYMGTALATAMAFAINSGVAIFGQNLDQLALPALVSGAVYSGYMFVLINASVLISANALVFHITYPRLAKVSGSREQIKRFLRMYDRFACAAAVLMIPLQATVFTLFNRLVYHGPSVGFVEALFASAIGWMYLLQIRETVLITALLVRHVVVGSCLVLGTYLLIMLIFRVSGVSISISACLLAVGASRAVYLLILWIATGRVLARLPVSRVGVVPA